MVAISVSIKEAGCYYEGEGEQSKQIHALANRLIKSLQAREKFKTNSQSDSTRFAGNH